jgi:hypothetical protein
VKPSKLAKKYNIFNVYGHVNYKYISNIYPTRCNATQFIYIWKQLYMFRVVPPPIIRSEFSSIYSTCYLHPLQCDKYQML